MLRSLPQSGKQSTFQDIVLMANVYFIPLSTDPDEAELSAAVDALQDAVVEGNTENILAACRKASAALAERNRLCKLNK